jgi:hypothetical protein
MLSDRLSSLTAEEMLTSTDKMENTYSTSISNERRQFGSSWLLQKNLLQAVFDVKKS